MNRLELEALVHRRRQETGRNFEKDHSMEECIEYIIVTCMVCDPPREVAVPSDRIADQNSFYICTVCRDRVLKRIEREKLYGQGGRRLEHGESIDWDVHENVT